MSNIVFRKQASKGAFSQAHVKAFNEAPIKREEGLTTLKGWRSASEWAKQVAHDKIYAQEAVNKLEAKNREEVRLAEIKDRERVFEAIQQNRRIEIRNIKIEGENQMRMLDSLSKFVGAGGNIVQAEIQKRRAKIDEENKKKILLLTTTNQVEAVYNRLNTEYSDPRDRIEEGRTNLLNVLGEGEAAKALIDYFDNIDGYAKESANRILAHRIASDPRLLERFGEEKINMLSSSGENKVGTFKLNLDYIKDLAQAGNEDFGTQHTNQSFKELELLEKKFGSNAKALEIILQGAAVLQEKRRSGFNTQYKEAEARNLRKGRSYKWVGDYEAHNNANDKDPEKTIPQYIDWKLKGLKTGALKKRELGAWVQEAIDAVNSEDLDLDDARYIETALIKAHGAKKGEKRLPIHHFVAGQVEELNQAIAAKAKQKADAGAERYTNHLNMQKGMLSDLQNTLANMKPEEIHPEFWRGVLDKIDPSDAWLANKVAAMATDHNERYDELIRSGWERDMIIGKLDENTILMSFASGEAKRKMLTALREWRKGEPKTKAGIEFNKGQWNTAKHAIVQHYGYYGEKPSEWDATVHQRIEYAKLKYNAAVNHYISKEGMSEIKAAEAALGLIKDDIKEGRFVIVDGLPTGNGTGAEITGVKTDWTPEELEEITPDSLYRQLRFNRDKIIFDRKWFNKYTEMNLRADAGESVNFAADMPLWNLVTFAASRKKGQSIKTFLDKELEKVEKMETQREGLPLSTPTNKSPETDFTKNFDTFSGIVWDAPQSIQNAFSFGETYMNPNVGIWLLKYQEMSKDMPNFWRGDNYNVLSPFAQEVLNNG